MRKRTKEKKVKTYRSFEEYKKNFYPSFRKTEGLPTVNFGDDLAKISLEKAKKSLLRK